MGRQHKAHTVQQLALPQNHAAALACQGTALRSKPRAQTGHWYHCRLRECLRQPLLWQGLRVYRGRRRCGCDGRRRAECLAAFLPCAPHHEPPQSLLFSLRRTIDTHTERESKPNSRITARRRTRGIAACFSRQRLVGFSSQQDLDCQRKDKSRHVRFIQSRRQVSGCWRGECHFLPLPFCAMSLMAIDWLQAARADILNRSRCSV